MAVDFSKDVDYVARLARLDLDPGEKKVMALQLGSILETARRVQELDTSAVEPTAHVVSLPALLREDETGPSLPREEALQNAPRVEKGFFRVPRITAADKE